MPQLPAHDMPSEAGIEILFCYAKVRGFPVLDMEIGEISPGQEQMLVARPGQYTKPRD